MVYPLSQYQNISFWILLVLSMMKVVVMVVVMTTGVVRSVKMIQ